jgi:predicted membrane metal-binding protein
MENEKEVKSAFVLFMRFLPLMIFLAIIGSLLYVVLTGIGPDWLRTIIALGLVGTVLVIAAVGWQEHWKDME